MIISNSFTRKPYRLFFLYGSLLNKSLHEHYHIKPEALTTACFYDCTIGFFGHSRILNSGLETFLFEPNRELWGVVFKVSHSDAETLDVLQDVRLDGTGTYFHYPVTVYDIHKNPFSVFIYKKDSLGEYSMPSKEYLDFILQGASDYLLPYHFISFLRSFQTRPYNNSIPNEHKFNKLDSFNATCVECGDLRSSKVGLSY